jgi:hypothetical protein
MTRTLIFWTAACCLATAAAAAPPPINMLRIERVPMGSGLQNAKGTDNAEPVGDLGVWHVPQYMAGVPDLGNDLAAGGDHPVRPPTCAPATRSRRNWAAASTCSSCPPAGSAGHRAAGKRAPPGARCRTLRA